MKNRKLNRLSGYDYSRNGYYFVTICTKRHNSIFGEIPKTEVILNEIGEIAKDCLLEIFDHFEIVEIDYFVVMPNHVHAIVVIDDGMVLGNDESVGNSHGHSLQTQRMKMLLPNVINGYKSSVTRLVRKQLNNYEFAWQKSYHDHIIRSDKSLDSIRQYIYENPLNWEKDKYYPDLV